MNLKDKISPGEKENMKSTYVHEDLYLSCEIEMFWNELKFFFTHLKLLLQLRINDVNKNCYRYIHFLNLQSRCIATGKVNRMLWQDEILIGSSLEIYSR